MLCSLFIAESTPFHSVLSLTKEIDKTQPYSDNNKLINVFEKHSVPVCYCFLGNCKYSYLPGCSCYLLHLQYVL